MQSDNTNCSFKVYLSNRAIENENDRKVSSAADFRVILDEILNLNTRIFLRAMSAEMSLDEFHLFDIPLTVTSTDEINLQLHIPPETAQSNILITPHHLETENQITYCQKLKEFTATENKELISFVNKQLNNRTNTCIIKRYMELFTDTNLFNEQFSPNRNIHFSKAEIELCLYYIELVCLFRETILNIITVLLKEPEPRMLNSTFHRSMTKERETNILTDSIYMLQTTERMTGRRKIFSLETYVNLSNASEKQSAIDQFESDFLQFLQDSDYLDFDTVEGEKVLKHEKEIQLKDLRNRNINILLFGSKCQEILSLIADENASILLHSNILTLSVDDTSKCHFVTHPEKFLVGSSSVTTTFRGHICYVLGSNNPKNELTIGPLTSSPSNLSNVESTSDAQLTQSCMRVQPKLVHVLFDMISNDCRLKNLWLRDTEYENFFIVETISNNAEAKKNRCLLKQTKDCLFCRIRQANNFVDNVRMVLVDENFKKLNFAFQTYCDYAICIRPSLSD